MPSRQFQQRRTPSIIVIVLLLLAVIVGAVLLSAGNDSGDSSSSSTIASTTDATVASVAVVGNGGPVAIAGITSFDPGDVTDGSEHPDQTPNVIDGDPSSTWKTNCYDNKYFNGKPGVGLVVSLTSPATGALTVAIANAPYQLRIYASNADSPPGSVDAWGSPIGPKNADTVPGTVAATIADPARYILVLLLEAAPDSGCRGEFPFRGSISEISFAAA